MKGFCVSTPCIRGLFFLFLIAVFSSSHTLQAQDNSVTIGGTEIRSDAVLYLIANGDQGLILPAVDNVNAFTPSESGMVAFNRADSRVYYYDGSAWVGVGGGSSGGGDAYSLRLQGVNLELLINGDIQDQISLVEFTVGGDLSGNIQAASVVALNGESLPGGSPTTNQILVYDGSNWTYQALPSGTFTGVTVDGTTITGDGDSTPLAVGQISTAEISDISSAGSGSIITNAERNQITTNQTDIAGKQDDVLTTSGDIIYHDGTGPSRLAAGTNGQVLQLSGGFPVWQTLAASTGDITDVIAGTGLTGGGTSGSVTLNLGTTGVTAGTYPKVTVNAQGRITNGANLVAADIPNLTLAKITDAGGLAALGAVSGGPGGTITDVSITNDDISNTANINVQKLDFSGTTDGDVLQIAGGVPVWSAAGSSNDAQSLQGTAIDPALATPADGEVLKWNNTNSRWEAAPDDVGGGGAPTLNDGQLIVGNGTSNSAAGVNGDLTMSGSANFQIAPDAVTTTEIGTAGITDADKVLTTDISGNPQWELKSSFVSGLDTDPSNEFNTDFRVNAGNLEVVDAGGVLAVPLTSINTDAQDLANVLGVSNDAGANAIINLANPTNPQDAATKAYVDANAGTGDMLTSTYDTDANNIVDNAEQLGGQLPSFYLDNTDAQDLANVLGVSNDAGTNAIINLADPTNPQDAATKAYVDANAGTGDMLTSTYDTDANNIVDNAEQLGGQLPSFYLDNTDAQDLANVLGVSNDAGANAIINLANPTNPQDAATKAYVDANAGSGDMLTGTYDIDTDNIVDDAEQLGGQLPAFYLDNTDAQDLANVLGVSNDAGATAIINLADPTNPQDAATKAYVDANGGATDLSGLSDANVTTPADGQILVYDGVTDNQFENVSISGDISMAANGSTAIQTGAGDNILAAINDAGTTQSVNINRINPPGGTDKGFLTTDGTTNTWLTTALPNRVFGTDQANALTARTVALSTGAAVDNIGVRAAGTASDANLVSEAAVREAIDAVGVGWSLTGNAGTVDGTNFIGTTDNVPLTFRVGNVQSGRIEFNNLNANTFFGYSSGSSNSGDFNTGIGWSALQVNAGHSNTSIGSYSLLNNNTGFANTVVGRDAMRFNTDGSANTAVGITSLYQNTTGNSNTAIGGSAMNSNTTGFENVAVGNQALQNNTIGNSNTAVGFYALISNTANNNVAMGHRALSDNTTGTGNTGIGYYAGYTTTFANANTTGSDNTYIGYNAGPGTTTQYNNATAIGANARVNQSNSLILGNNANVGIGTSTPPSLLTVGSGEEFRVDNAGNLVRIKDVVYDWPVSNGAGVLTNDGTGTLSWGAAGSSSLQAAYDGGSNITMAGGQNLAIETSSAFPLFNLDEVNGRVGIGTATPISALQVEGNNTGGITTRVVNTNSQGWADLNLQTDAGNFSLSVGASAATTGAGKFYIFNSGTPHVALDQTGNFGIGTENPLSKLQVENTMNLFYDESQGTDVLSHNLYEAGTGDFRYHQTAGSSALVMGDERMGFFTFQSGTAGSTLGSLSMRMNMTSTGLVVNGDNPDPSAMLDVSSTTSGLLVPRMTTVQRDAIVSPATSLLIFNTTDNAYNYYDGVSWLDFSGGGSLWTDISPDIAYTSGDVGIGTNAPTGRLEVEGDGSLLGGLRVSAPTSATYGSSIYLNGATKDWTISATNNSAGAGTDKFVIRDYSAATDRFTIDATGDVGIGTTSPEQRLDVIGYARIGVGAGSANEGLLLYSPSPGLSIIRAGGRATSEFRLDQSNNAPMTFLTNGTERMRIDGTGNVGIGTSTSAGYIINAFGGNMQLGKSDATDVGLVLNGDSNGISWMIGNEDSNNADFIISSGSTLANPKLFIENSGDIGFGTTTPNVQHYQPVNTVAIPSTYTFSSGDTYADNSPAIIELHGSSADVNDEIGVINFTHQHTTGVNYNFARISAHRDNSNPTYASLRFYNRLGATLSETMRITPAGEVGIGTDAPNALLSVNGTASKVGGGSWSTFSDKRVKKNINEYTDGLEQLLKINPVKYQYNGLAGYDANGKYYVGVIAQEIQQIAPYMVESKAMKLRPEDTHNTDILLYDESALTYMLVNSIQEQQEIIEEQKKEIEALKAIVSKMEASDSNTQAQLDLMKTQIEKLTQILTAEANKNNE